MKTKSYKISKQAIIDLNNIWTFTFKNWSKDQADRYYALIIDELEYIADNYLIGKSVVQTRNNYRVCKMKSHLIFYRKVEGELVEIVRILHQRMDIKKYLNK